MTTEIRLSQTCDGTWCIKFVSDYLMGTLWYTKSEKEARALKEEFERVFKFGYAEGENE